MTNATFTDEDKNLPPALGPEYGASNRLAEAMLEKFEVEHLKPLIENVVDEFRDKLWGDVTDWLLSDTEMNVATEVRYIVEQTVTALLTGEKWAMERYPYANYTKGEKIREAICKHSGDSILARRVADLEAELTRKDETIKSLRGHYY